MIGAFTAGFKFWRPRLVVLGVNRLESLRCSDDFLQGVGFRGSGFGFRGLGF